jgi:hypothetical protein
VPSAKVVNGNYDPPLATKLDDLGSQSSNPYSVHIGIIW